MPLSRLATRIKSGGTPRRAVPNYWAGSIPFVKIQDITRSSGEIHETEETISEAGLNNSSAWLVPPNSVLLSMYASIGEVSINRTAVATNQAIVAIIPNELVIAEFLYFALRFFGCDLVSYNIQTTQKNVNKGIVERFPIPVPPLPEQHAITRVLRTIQRARDAADVVIAATRGVGKSLLRHLFTYGTVDPSRANAVPVQQTEIGTVPDAWAVRSLGTLIGDGPQNGLYKPQSLYGQGTPIIRINDFGNEGDIVTRAPVRLQASEAEVERYGLRTDDILVNRVNSMSHLGKVALVGDLVEPTLFESNMMRFRVEASLAQPHYVFRFLASPMGRNQLRARARHAVAQSSVNQHDVKAVLVPLPPLPVQDEIAKALHVVDFKLAAEKSRRCALDTLFNTLLHDLMAGKRRVGEIEPIVADAIEVA